MGIRLVPADYAWMYREPDDVIRVDFDAWPLLQRAGLTIEEAEESPHRWATALDEFLGEDFDAELRSPVAHIGPDAGDWVNTFLDVVVATGSLIGAVEVAARIRRKLRELSPRVYVSRKGIEALARQQLRFHGHPEDKALLDEMLPLGVREPLPGHDVSTASFAGVAGLPSGELIRRPVDAGDDMKRSSA